MAALLCAALLCVALAGCEEPPTETESDIRFRQAGTVISGQLDEISGLAASRRHPGLLWTHNDDGRARVHALGTDGSDRGHFDIVDGVNVDWEDMTAIPMGDRDALVLADIGDNEAQRTRVWLYIVEEPAPDEDGRFSGEREAINWISLRYPDGPRDAESIAWDPVAQRLLILSKRDRPPRLYALDGVVALEDDEAELSFIGEMDTLRGPTAEDRFIFGNRAAWVSQPTGLSITRDGRRAALLTYRSLYLYDLPAGGSWNEGFSTPPTEVLGPPRDNEEAVVFKPDGTGLWISTEGDRAPLFEFVFRAE